MSLTPGLLFNMGVVIDVILAVAEVAVATGAVAELQLGIGHIGATAYGTAVQIGGLSFFLALVKGDCSGGPLLPGSAMSAGADRLRQQIQYILTGKQQEIGNADQREQIMREQVAHIAHINDQQNQVKNAQEPGLYRDNEENQKLAVRIGNGEDQKQSKVHIPGHIAVNISTHKLSRQEAALYSNRIHRRKDHGKDHHQQHSGKIEKIELEGSHNQFHVPG